MCVYSPFPYYSANGSNSLCCIESSLQNAARCGFQLWFSSPMISRQPTTNVKLLGSVQRIPTHKPGAIKGFVSSQRACTRQHHGTDHFQWTKVIARIQRNCCTYALEYVCLMHPMLYYMVPITTTVKFVGNSFLYPFLSREFLASAGW